MEPNTSHQSEDSRSAVVLGSLSQLVGLAARLSVWSMFYQVPVDPEAHIRSLLHVSWPSSRPGAEQTSLYQLTRTRQLDDESFEFSLKVLSLSTMTEQTLRVPAGLMYLLRDSLNGRAYQAAAGELPRDEVDILRAAEEAFLLVDAHPDLFRTVECCPETKLVLQLEASSIAAAHSAWLYRKHYFALGYYKVADPEIDEDAFRQHARRWRVGQHRSLQCTVDDDGLQNEILRLYQAHKGPVINVGAADGVAGDPIWPIMLAHNPKALFIEGNAERTVELVANIKKAGLSHVFLWESYLLDPENISEAVHQWGYPETMIGVLKVDIDAWDCEVAETFLKMLGPVRMVVMETNPIPPPLKFRQEWNANWSFASHPLSNATLHILRGCSVSAQIDLFSRFGLRLHRFNGHDAIFLHNSIFDGGVPGKAMDEFECYRRGVIMGARDSWPDMYYREWFFNFRERSTLSAVRRNISQLIQRLPSKIQFRWKLSIDKHL